MKGWVQFLSQHQIKLKTVRQIWMASTKWIPKGSFTVYAETKD